MIGVFDSGVGGLTAVKEIIKKLPHEDLIYFGDTARVPYGTRSPETIIKYAKQDMRFLISKNVDAVLVACGTVSSIAIDELRMHFDLPIFGIVEAGAESAVKNTKNGVVAVIGTNATIRSKAFEYQINKIDKQIKVVSVALGFSR
jgi:glutamate racemase